MSDEQNVSQLILGLAFFLFEGDERDRATARVLIRVSGEKAQVVEPFFQKILDANVLEEYAGDASDHLDTAFDDVPPGKVRTLNRQEVAELGSRYRSPVELSHRSEDL